MGQKFPELVNLGDFLEEGIKSDMIQSMAALQAASKVIQFGLISRGKEKEDISSIIPYYQSNPPHRDNFCPMNTHPSHKPTYDSVYNTQPYYSPQPQYNPPHTYINSNPPRSYAPVQTTTHQDWHAYAPRLHPNFKKRIHRNYTPIAEPFEQLFKRLRRVGLIYPVEGRILEHISQYYDVTRQFVYHSGVPRHDIEDYSRLKNEIESLIKSGAIHCTRIHQMWTVTHCRTVGIKELICFLWMKIMIWKGLLS